MQEVTLFTSDASQSQLVRERDLSGLHCLSGKHQSVYLFLVGIQLGYLLFSVNK